MGRLYRIFDKLTVLKTPTENEQFLRIPVLDYVRSAQRNNEKGIVFAPFAM